MKTPFLLLAAHLTCVIGTAAAADQPAPASAAALDGKALYQEKCIMCHDTTGMGTGLLARRVQPAELLLRSDLLSVYVVQAARVGVGNMPAIPRGEASDEQLKAIGDFLATPPAKRP